MKKPQLSELTLREKIGQCLCIPQFDLQIQSEVDRRKVRPTEEKHRIVENNQFGCIWCHGGLDLGETAQLATDFSIGGRLTEPDDMKSWIKDTEKTLKIPALHSTDSENGATEITGMTQTVPAIALGAANSEELCYQLGAAVAKELLCAGINWRWTPVVDVMSRFSMSVNRAISHKADDIIRFANANIKGMQDNGVAATAKHFPGGDRYEYRDSHFSPAMNSSTMEEWWEEQGKIFQGIIDGGVWSIMTRHASFPACDDTKIRGNVARFSFIIKLPTFYKLYY